LLEDREHLGELNRIAVTRGVAPTVLRLDNGPEMIAAALADWAGTRTGMLFIPPGEPWRNPFIEWFNSRLRDECLIINLFQAGGFHRGAEALIRPQRELGVVGFRSRLVITMASRIRSGSMYGATLGITTCGIPPASIADIVSLANDAGNRGYRTARAGAAAFWLLGLSRGHRPST